MSAPGSTRDAYDVVVLGAGPAGIAAARAAASAGVRVALVESTRPGGACVHETCVPTEILLRTVAAYTGAEQLDALGIAGLGSPYLHRRAVARKDELVRSLSATVARSLTTAPVDVLDGFGELLGASRVHVGGPELDLEISADAVVVTAGCSWVPPTVAGLSADQVLTPDVMHSGSELPKRVSVLGSANSGGLFPLEYAAYLLAVGVDVEIIGPGAALLPALDGDLQPLVVAAFEALGCAVHVDTSAEGREVEVLLAADCRMPNTSSVGLAALGLDADGPVRVDERAACAEGVYAAGDVTGGAMLSSAASTAGAVAGANAAGGSHTLPPLTQQPFVVHGLVPAGWVGLTEAAVQATGIGPVVGIAEATGSAQAVVTASEGTAVKIVADDIGQLLGVHAVGEGAGEIVNAAATLIQLEVTVDDVAALRPWHPSWTEILVDAARAATA